MESLLDSSWIWTSVFGQSMLPEFLWAQSYSMPFQEAATMHSLPLPDTRRWRKKSQPPRHHRRWLKQQKNAVFLMWSCVKLLQWTPSLQSICLNKIFFVPHDIFEEISRILHSGADVTDGIMKNRLKNTQPQLIFLVKGKMRPSMHYHLFSWGWDDAVLQFFNM